MLRQLFFVLVKIKLVIFGCWQKIYDLMWYNTDTSLADANLGIGNLMQSVADGHLRIKALDIDWHKICTWW